MTEHHIAHNEEDEGRGEENAELLINYDNVETTAKKTYMKKIVKLMKKENLRKPPNLRRIDRVRLKEKNKIVAVVRDSIKTSNITEYNKLAKCGH